MSTRLAVLASGRGSNLRALHEYLSRSGRDSLAHLALVLSDHADAGALAYARSRDIAFATIDGGTLGGDRLLAQLGSHRIDIVVLAGYMRLVPEVVVNAYRGRIVNVHPALLPVVWRTRHVRHARARGRDRRRRARVGRDGAFRG